MVKCFTMCNTHSLFLLAFKYGAESKTLDLGSDLNKRMLFIESEMMMMMIIK